MGRSKEKGGKGRVALGALGEDKRQLVVAGESGVSPGPPPCFLTVVKSHVLGTCEV